MNKVIEFVKKYQLIRLLSNGLFLYIFIQMAYQNLLNDHDGRRDFNTPYLFHQITITVMYYVIVYFTLFYFSYHFLFKKKIAPFYLLTLLTMLIGGLILTFYHEYLCQQYAPVYQFILVPIDLNVYLEDNSFLTNLLEIYQKLGFLYIMLALSFFARNFFIERRTKELLQQQQTESELAQLKSQINPHFLFNVLNSIYSLAIKQSDKTPDIVMRLSDLLRYMLYEAKAESILLKKEIQLISDYLEIEKIRLSPNQQIELQTQGEFELYKIAPLLFLPFAENAVKFGLDSMAGDGYVRINITCVKNRCTFICENTFKENNSQAAIETSGGIGIENVSKRLALLYPNRHHLDIKKETNLFIVTLELQLEI